MSQTVDQRVVEMRFDNKQFESAIADTQKTVKTFNKNLNKEFGDSNKDLDRLGDTADAVRIKFNALDMLKFEALHRVFDTLIAKGEQVVKAFTIDPISTGWQKYADKTSAVQTIMSATATKFNNQITDAYKKFTEAGDDATKKEEAVADFAKLIGSSTEDVVKKFSEIGDISELDLVAEQLDYVNSKVEKLNYFADETSASLTDMTTNIGKFTAAGVDLETAVTAMQGIATWGFLSGANTAQQERVMTNLAQALGQGSVRVQDWMSVENASMATEEFKQMAIEAGLAIGTLKKDLDGIVYAPDTKAGVDVTAENFRTTLQEGWLTNEVLMKVLNEYGKAADVLYEMSELTSSNVETTKDMLDILDEYKAAANDAGREEAFAKLIDGLDPEKNAYEISKLREQIELLASSEYDLAVKAFKASQEAKTFQEAIDSVKDAVSTKWMNIFEDVFGNYLESKKIWSDVADTMWDIFASPIEAITKATQYFHDNGGPEKVKETIVGILEAISEVSKTVRSTINLLLYGTDDAEEVAEKRGQKFLDIIDFIQKKVKVFKEFVSSEPFKDSLLAIGHIFGAVVDVIKAVWRVGKTIFTAIGDAVSEFISTIAKKGTEEKKITFVYILGWIREKLTSFAEWLSSSDTLNWIADKIGKFVKFILELPGKLNNGFKKLTGSTIGESLKKLWNKIKDGFQWLVDNKVFQNIWDGIKSFFSMIGNGLKKIANVNTYGELFGKIKDKIVDIFNAIKGLFSKKDKDSLVSTAYSTSVSNIKKTGSILQKIGDALKNFFSGVWGFVKNAISAGDIKNIGDLLKKVFEGITNFVKAIDWKDVLSVAIAFKSITKSISRVQLSTAILKMSKVFVDVGIAIKNFGWAAYELGKAKKKYASAAQLRAVALVILSIAAVVAVIALSIYKLGKLDEKALVQGATVVGIIFIAVIALVAVILASLKALSKTFNKKGADPAAIQKTSAGLYKSMAAVALVLLAVGKLVSSLVNSIIKLAKVGNPEAVNSAAIIVVGLLVVVFIMIKAIMTLMKDYKEGLLKNGGVKQTVGDNAVKAMLSVALILVAMAAVIAILVTAIAKIAILMRVVGKDTVWNAFGVVAGILVLTAAFTVLISKMATQKGIGKNTYPVILSLATMFAALGILITAITISLVAISAIKPNRLGQSMAVLAAITGLIIILMLVAKFIMESKVTGDTYKTMLSMAVLFTALGIMTLAIAGALKIMATADPKKLLVAAVAFVGILVALAAAVYITKNVPWANFLSLSVTLVAMGAAMIAMSYAMILMLPVIATLATFNFSTLAKVAGGILLILAAFGVGGILLSKGWVGLLAFGAFIATLAVSLLVISAAVLVFGVALSVLGEGIEAFSEVIVQAGPVIKEAVRVLVQALIIAIEEFSVGMVQILISLTEVVTELLIAAIVALCNVIIQCVPQITEALKVIILSVLDLLISIAPQLVETIMTIVMLVLESLSTHAYEIGNLLCKILIQIIQAVSDNIGPIVEALAGLFVNLFDALVEYIPMLTEGVSKVLFSIVDSTLGAILRGVFESFGSALATFAEAAKPFFEALKGIDPDVLNAVAALGTMMIAITASAVIDGISKFLSFGKDSPLVSFGKQLAEFAPYLMSFANSIRGINAEQVEAAANAGKMLSEMYNNLPKSGGLLQQFFGESMNLEEFGKQLKQFANGFVAFYKVIEPISPIDQALVESAAKAGKTLAGLYNALPKSGGVMQKFFGESMSLKEFGSQLVDFAYGFVGFYNVIKEVSPIDQSIVDGATRAGKALAGLYNNLPKSGGVMQKIFGETMSLKDFGQDLVDFAKGFVNFYREITKETIDQKIVRFVTDAALSLAGLYNNMPKKGGLLASFFGETMSLKDFGDDLVDFAKGFNSFYTEITKQTIDEGIITTVTTSGQALAALYTALPKENNIFQDIFGGGQVDLKDFGTQLTYFGEGFTKFYNALPSSIDEGLIKAATNAGETIAGLYDKLPKDATGFFQDVFGSKHVDLADFGDQLKKFGEGFSDFYEALPTEVNQDIVNAAATAGETMAGLYKSINESGITKSGWIQSIFGKKTVDLGDFGDQLAQFGSGFKGFYEEVKGLSVNQDLVTSISNAGLSLVGLYTALTPSGGFWEDVQKLTGKSKDKTIEGMGTVATEVGGILKKINEMYTNGDISATNTSFFAASATNLIQVFKDLTAGTGIKADKIKSTLSTAVTAIVEAFSTDLTSKTTGIPKSGTDAAKEVLNSFEARINPNTNNAAKMSLNSSVSSVVEYFTGTLKNSLTTKLADIGTWVAAGLEAGLSSEEATQSVYNAGYSVANAVEQGVRNKLMVQSPSKVMIDIGKYVSEGLAIGIKDYAYKATDEATDMGFETIDAVSQAISKSKDILGSNLDDGSLVITPVLDLSEIQNGAAIISQMMQNASGDTFGGTFDYANRTAASRGTADIYDPSVVSLDKLSGAIEELLRNPQGISNNFTINSNADPKEIAEEVSKIIQTQVERRQAVWAR